MASIGISLLLLLSLLFVVTFGYIVKNIFFIRVSDNTGVMFSSFSFLMIYFLLISSLDILRLGTLCLWIVFLLLFFYIIIKEREAFGIYIKSYEIQAFLWASLAFIVLYTIISPFFIDWDEFSHWGPFYKSIKETGKLHVFLDRKFIHQAYPQGISLLFYGLTFPIAEFSEKSVYCIYAFVIIACSLSILPPKKCANLFVGIIVPSFVILLYFLFPYISPYATVYLDTLLGAYFGACVILILKFKDLTYRNILLHIINIAALMQVKDISIVLALLCIFILFIRYFFLKREKILCKKTVLFIGGIFLGLFWWKIILLLTNKREDQFSNLQLGDFLNGLMNFGKNGNYFSDVFYAFIDAFINRSIMLGGISTIYIAILLGILSLIIVFKEEDLYHKLAVSLFPLFFIGYCLILLVVYEIAMSPSEALAVNSYERYISTFFIAWMILIVYEYLRIIKKLTIFKCFPMTLILCVCCLSVILNDGLRIGINKDDTGRAIMEKISVDSNNFIGENKNIWYVTDSDLNRYIFRYLFMPNDISMEVPLLSEEEYLDFPQISQNNGIDYLLLWQLPDYFYEVYGNIFDGTLSWLQNTSTTAGLYIYNYSEQEFQMVHLITIT